MLHRRQKLLADAVPVSAMKVGRVIKQNMKLGISLVVLYSSQQPAPKSYNRWRESAGAGSAIFILKYYPLWRESYLLNGRHISLTIFESIHAKIKYQNSKIV